MHSGVESPSAKEIPDADQDMQPAEEAQKRTEKITERLHDPQVKSTVKAAVEGWKRVEHAGKPYHRLEQSNTVQWYIFMREGEVYRLEWMRREPMNTAEKQRSESAIAGAAVDDSDWKKTLFNGKPYHHYRGESWYVFMRTGECYKLEWKKLPKTELTEKERARRYLLIPDKVSSPIAGLTPESFKRSKILRIGYQQGKQKEAEMLCKRLGLQVDDILPGIEGGNVFVGRWAQPITQETLDMIEKNRSIIAWISPNQDAWLGKRHSLSGSWRSQYAEKYDPQRPLGSHKREEILGLQYNDRFQREIFAEAGVLWEDLQKLDNVGLEVHAEGNRTIINCVHSFRMALTVGDQLSGYSVIAQVTVDHNTGTFAVTSTPEHRRHYEKLLGNVATAEKYKKDFATLEAGIRNLSGNRYTVSVFEEKDLVPDTYLPEHATVWAKIEGTEKSISIHLDLNEAQGKYLMKRARARNGRKSALMNIPENALATPEICNKIIVDALRIPQRK